MRIIRHEMPDPPPEHPRKHFTLNPRIFPARLLPPLLEDPPVGRQILKAGIRAPIFEPGDNVRAYRADAIRAEQEVLRARIYVPPELPPEIAVRT